MHFVSSLPIYDAIAIFRLTAQRKPVLLLGLCLISGLIETAPARNSTAVSGQLNEEGAAAQFARGEDYYHGRGVVRDYEQALKWIRLAAEQGHSDAQHYLAAMYEAGEGVAQDYKEAMRWFRLSADQGNGKAQHNLGIMYVNGEGVAYEEAANWFRLAVEQASPRRPH